MSANTKTKKTSQKLFFGIVIAVLLLAAIVAGILYLKICGSLTLNFLFF